mmetsp:Transcript_52252/g.150476  ORF Transcript_52252/g.150476 Transcript_52252/m.150476 type:complete len:245 (-) Transcript_52252:164-898(-)
MAHGMSLRIAVRPTWPLVRHRGRQSGPPGHERSRGVGALPDALNLLRLDGLQVALEVDAPPAELVPFYNAHLASALATVAFPLELHPVTLLEQVCALNLHIAAQVAGVGQLCEERPSAWAIQFGDHLDHAVTNRLLPLRLRAAKEVPLLLRACLLAEKPAGDVHLRTHIRQRLRPEVDMVLMVAANADGALPLAHDLAGPVPHKVPLLQAARCLDEALLLEEHQALRPILPLVLGLASDSGPPR